MTQRNYRQAFGLKILNSNHAKVRQLKKEGYVAEIHGNKFWNSSFLIMSYLKKQRIPKKYKVLEIGCKKGFLIQDLQELLPGIKAIGIENHRYPISKASVKVKNKLYLKNYYDLEKFKRNQFDLIISNPPYVDQQTMNRLPIEFLKEPQIALAGGTEGIDLIQKIIIEAPKYLNANGVLIMEVGRDRKVIETKFPRINFTWIETQAGRDFVLFVTREDLRLGLTN